MAKPKRGALPPLSDAQLEIMHLVWDGGEVTVTEVWKALSQRRRVARNTILTLMKRLEKKGWLERRPHGRTHHYRATVSREMTLGEVVDRLVDTAFAGSVEGLVLALLEGRGVTRQEADRVRQLIQEARKKKR